MSGLLDQLQNPELVALRTDAERWARGQLIPDRWIGLVLSPDGRRWLAPAGEDPRPARGGALLLVRNQPFAVPVALHDSAAACGADVSAEIELLVRWPPREDELAALARSGLADPELRLAELAESVSSGGARSSLARWVRAHAAAELVDTDQREAWEASLRDDLRGFLFDVGLELNSVARFEVHSRLLTRQRAVEQTVSRQQLELEAQSRLHEAALAATRQQLTGLAALFEQLQKTARASGGEDWTAWLAKLAPGERGRLLEELWRISPRQRRTVALLVLSAAELAWLTPTPPHKLLQRCRIPPELGPLRAVAWDEQTGELLVGASLGLWRLDAESGAVRDRHALPAALHGAASAARFSRILSHGEFIFASHGALGLWRFHRTHASEPQPFRTTEAEGIPRHGALVALPAEQLAFSGGGIVSILTRAGERAAALWLPTGAGRVHALAFHEGRLYAATEAAGLLAATLPGPLAGGPPAQPAPGPAQPALGPAQAASGNGGWTTAWAAPQPVEAIAARRWGNLLELLLPAGERGITALYPSECFEAPLVTGSFPIRRVWATEDVVLGLSAARDRLLVMTDASPRRAGAEILLAREMGALIEDLACHTVAAPADVADSAADSPRPTTPAQPSGA